MRTVNIDFGTLRRAMSHLALRLTNIGIDPYMVRAEVDPMVTLQEQIASAQRQATQIQAQADAEGRAFTEEEERDFQGAVNTVSRITRQIQMRQSMADLSAALTAPTGRRTGPNGGDPSAATVPARPAGTIVVQQPNVARDPRGGYNNLGDFLSAVRQAAVQGTRIDDRLQAALIDYGNESTPQDGGFAIPPDFRTAIWQKVTGETSLLSRTDQVMTAFNQVTFPKDESTPWDDSAGIKANWTGEAQTKAQSKPALDQSTVRLHKLTCLVPMTDELLDDAPAMTSYVQRKAGEKIDFKVSFAVVQGTGIGQPQGILNSGALVTAPKVGSQSADTILFPNIAAMWARMWAPSRPNSVWLLHPQVEEQLALMAFQRTAADPTSPVPVYLPANSVAGSPFATLYGRPVIQTQVANALGDLGDIMLVDLQQFLALMKVGGVRQDVSIHVFFEQDVTAFRFVLRIGGQTWWSTPVASRVGTLEQSPFVVLEAR